MNKTFTKLKCTALAAAALSAFCAIPAFAQLNYRPNTATNTTTTYTDLGTTGTAITVANNDDANSAAQPIGFTFNYNGQAFTQFILNTNGFIKLGSTAPSAANLINAIGSANAADVNMLAALSNIDLQGAANQTTSPTEFRVATTGTAPNRVTTIQFENLADKLSASAPAQFSTMQFQIKLYETTNVVEFVYGPWTANTATPTGQPFIIGLKGSSNAVADRLMAYKGSSAALWSTTTFVTEDPTSPGFLAAHFIRNAVLPDAGRTYRFTPVVIPANDAMVQAVYSLGKIALQAGTNSDVIQARVRNNGSTPFTNLPVTLTMTGANTFTQTVTIPTLAVGQTVTVNFPAFTPTTAGSNAISVSIPSDTDNTNNSGTSTTVVTPATLSYAATNVSDNSVGFGPTGNAAFLVRLKTTGTAPVRINTVRAYIDNDVNAVGKTVYGVVVDSLGNLIGRSPDYVITNGDLETYKAFTVTTTPTSGIAPMVTNTAFYVGLAQPTYTGTQYFPMGFQNETPQRSKAFYTWGLAATTPTKPVESLSGRRFMIEADVTSTLGVKEELNAKLVAVYPNPSNGDFKVSAKDMKGNNLNLVVRDLQGKVVYRAAADKEGTTLNLKNVAAGVYMLQLSTDAQIAVKRLVIE